MGVVPQTVLARLGTAKARGDIDLSSIGKNLRGGWAAAQWMSQDYSRAVLRPIAASGRFAGKADDGVALRMLWKPKEIKAIRR